MKNEMFDIIIVGGGPAGIISAITAKKHTKKKRVLLIREINRGLVPCGIPYMFFTLKRPEDNILNTDSLKENKIITKIEEVIKINRKKKEILTKNSKKYKYNKLILATGSIPMTLPIEGVNLQGVYPIYKSLNYLKNLKKELKKSKDIIIIGGGFIGVEFADELSKFKTLNLSIVELLPSLLSNSFDIEFSKLAEQQLIKRNVRIYSGLSVESINGKEKVESVLLSNGKVMPADMVILGIGAKPNISLAEKSGLKTSKFGISVDKYLRTSDKDIFAVGDCSENSDFFTKEKTNIMLASTATTQARIAGCNLSRNFFNKNIGVLSSYSTKVGGLTLSSTGMTEKTAIKNGFKVVTGNAESFDKHPKKMPYAGKIKVKLIFSNQSGVILGGQIAGGESAGEIINIISTAIQKKFSITEIESLQIATHPKLTPAPTTYPIINAAQDALEKINWRAK